MIRVVEIKQTCAACPSQWEGRTDDNRAVYVRYRFGTLEVSVSFNWRRLVPFWARHGIWWALRTEREWVCSRLVQRVFPKGSRVGL